jgi:hypothetical protein
MMEALNPHFSRIWRCVRVLAFINDPFQAPTPDFGFQKGDTMFDIEPREYFDMFNAIPWSWPLEEG